MNLLEDLKTGNLFYDYYNKNTLIYIGETKILEYEFFDIKSKTIVLITSESFRFMETWYQKIV